MGDSTQVDAAAIAGRRQRRRPWWRQPASPGRARAATTLRWASVLPANHPEIAMIERTAKQVRDQTGGAVEIQVFPAGQLGSSRDLIEATSTGAIQIVDEGAAQFGQFVPQFSILEAPYLWKRRRADPPGHGLVDPRRDECGARRQAVDARHRLDVLRQAPRHVRAARRSTPSTT